MKQCSTRISGGRARIQVVDMEGNLVSDHGWQKNLLLDQGMDNIATVLIADLFKYCAAGLTNTATKRTLTGNAEQAGGASVFVTSTDSEFSAADVGRMLKVGSNERRINGYINPTTISVIETGAFGPTGSGVVYNVDQTALFNEQNRTNNYGNSSNDNKTTTVGNVRTFKRTFLFSAEPEEREYKEIGFSDKVARPIIDIDSLAITAADVVTITTVEPLTLAGGGTGISIQGVTGSVPDINTSSTVATVTGANTFTVPLAGVSNAGTGGTFTPAAVQPNLNIRLKLSGTVTVAINQRLKVIYEFDLTVEPNTEQGPAASGITGGSGAQFSNPDAKWVIEKFSTSLVNLDGSMDDSAAELEPAVAGVMAMSDTTTDLSPMEPVVRNLNVEIKELTARAYVPGSYELEYDGLFDLEDGNSQAIKSLMIYDENSTHGVFTMKFTNPQTKNSDHSLSLVWKKTWSRELN